MADLERDEFRCIVDTAVNPFVQFDASGTITWAGASISELIGLEAADLVGRSILDFLTDEGRELAAETLATAGTRTSAGAPTAWEGGAPQLDVVLPDGTIVPCTMSVATPARTGLDHYVVQLRRAGGLPRLYQALAAMAEGRAPSDVLDHLRAMADLELPFTVITILFEWDGTRFTQSIGSARSLRDAVRTSDDESLPWNAAAERTTVVDVEALPRDISEAATATGATSCWIHTIVVDQPVPTRGAVLGWHTAPWQMTRFTEAALARLVRFVRLALQWAADRRALEWAASHDQLTGLHNRGAFFDRLRSLAPDARDERDGLVAVLYLDLDGFKQVNDQHGHGFGDNVLAIVAERIRRCVRTDDVVARLGGDEFAVLSPAIGDEHTAESLADRLIESVSRPIVVGGVSVQLGLSVGIAIRDHVPDADQVLDAADTALRAAKEAGKGAWRRV